MKCPKCAAEVNLESVFCHRCGERLLAEPSIGVPKGLDQKQSFQPNRGDLPSREPSGRDPADKFRPRRDDPEEVLWEGSYSPRAMVGLWLVESVLVMGGVALVVIFPGYWWIVLASLIALATVLAIMFAYRRLSVSYRLTTQRLFHHHGLLGRTSDRIETIDMDDVTSFQGPIERLLGVGSIRITSSDRTHPEFWLHGIDNVQEVALLLDDARRQERLRRGLHIESV